MERFVKCIVVAKSKAAYDFYPIPSYNTERTTNAFPSQKCSDA